MELLQSATLGIVQGITEFLPISSSAHLILFPWFLGWKEHSITFDVALHMGTLLAILLYFGFDFLIIIRDAFQKNRNAIRFIGLLLVGSIPGAAVGVLGEKTIEATLRGPATIAFAMITVGVLLGIADKWGDKSRTFESIGWVDAIIIGLAQALALWPGVSRSGITMAAALTIGLMRPAAARFSFILGAPIMLGAGLFEGRKILGGLPPGETWMGWGIGLVASTLTGILVIRFLLKYLQTHSFRPFIIYRIVLGLGIAFALLIK